MKPKFVMTAELEALRSRGRDHDAWAQGDTSDTSVRPPQHLLDVLPALDDIPGMVWYLGLDGTMSTQIMRKYEKKYSGTNALPPYKLIPKRDDPSKQVYTYPIMSKLRDIYLEREAGDEGDPDESYESYIRGGLTQGLRPEYAIFCGLHESEPRYTEGYASYFYTKSYQEHADNIVKEKVALFGMLWHHKLAWDKGNEPEGTESVGGISEKQTLDSSA